MTMFVAIAAALAAGALLFVLPPLLRRRMTAPDAHVAANATIYREQLEELGAELRRGALTREEYERASREVEHRIVAEHTDAGPAPAMHRPHFAVAISLAVLLPLAAALGYWQFGAPAALTGMASEPAHAVTPDQMEGLVERLAARLEKSPDDGEGWRLLGRSLTVLGRYERAAQAYGRAVKLLAPEANLLADYADTLAMALGRRLAGEPFALVKRALEVDPEHVKSLALAGSAEFEARNFPAAIGYWERLLKVTPPESDFARSVSSSIAEARSLAGGAPAPVAKQETPVPVAKQDTPAAKPQPVQGGVSSLQGTVTIDPALAAKLAPGDTVFVLARPAGGSRMPLAVARTTVSALPYRYTLDDSMAMSPGATISSQEKIVVAARVSKSGNAVPQKGDIEGASAPVAPGARNVNIVLSRVVD